MMPGSPAYRRQKAYAETFGALDIIGYTLWRDPFTPQQDGALHTYPTQSLARLFYGLSALRIASKLPWPDVVSTQDPAETGLFGLWVARFLKVPLHVQVHTDIFGFSYGLHSIINFIRLHIALYVLKRADGIRVVSQRIRESTEKRITPKRPITVLPIYADIEAIRHAAPDQALQNKFSRFTTKLLYVGRLEREKNPTLAIESFAKAAPIDACLIVVGSGSGLKDLKRLAAARNISNRVFFEGEREATPYFQIADLVLVTSRYEGYGLVIIEALAAGKPVLSTDVGAAKDEGAVISTEAGYADALAEWFTHGPRSAQLRAYPYKDFDDYVRLYCADIERAQNTVRS
jgi:glycosyltransferase involved in cell wall biosynthesis